VKPGIDLQIAHFFRSESQFHSTISAHKSVLRKAGVIFNRQVQKPLLDGAAADLTIFVHGKVRDSLGYFPIINYLSGVPRDGVLGFDLPAMSKAIPS
jgi:hypothetical protein